MRLERQAAERTQCQALQQEGVQLQARLAKYMGLPADLQQARQLCAETSARVNSLGEAFDESCQGYSTYS